MNCGYCTYRKRINFETTFCKLLNVDLAEEYLESGAPNACPLNSTPEAREIKESAGYKNKTPQVHLEDIQEFLS